MDRAPFQYLGEIGNVSSTVLQVDTSLGAIRTHIKPGSHVRCVQLVLLNVVLGFISLMFVSQLRRAIGTLKITLVSLATRNHRIRTTHLMVPLMGARRAALGSVALHSFSMAVPVFRVRPTP